MSEQSTEQGQQGQPAQQGQQAPQAGEQQSTDPWANPESARAEIEKLRRESAGYRTKVRELEPRAKKAQELEDAAKPELERLTERAAEAERRAAELERLNLRHQVALEMQIPGDLVEFLTGEDDKALREQAKKLLARVGGQQQQQGGQAPAPRPDLTQGSTPTGGVPGSDMNALIRRGISR